MSFVEILIEVRTSILTDDKLKLKVFFLFDVLDWQKIEKCHLCGDFYTIKKLNL